MKIDLKKQLKELYFPSVKEPVVVDVPKMKFLMVDGQGDPNNSQAFQEAINALYSVSYTLKFMSKKESGQDYTVMPLEGLWWMKDTAKFNMENKDEWLWTVMLAQPDFISGQMVSRAVEEVRRKKDLPALERLRFEVFDEGRAAQIMHIGPYEAEPLTIERLHRFAEAQGHKLKGKHHEIYLGDPRRTAPERLKTVIRHPIA